MGRGRQKAKQTKVARELKYHSSDIDVSALQRELSTSPSSWTQVRQEEVEEQEDDQYSRYADMYNDDDEDDGGQIAARR